MSPPTVDIVVPTIGRMSLACLLQSLFDSVGRPPERLIVVDDRARSRGDIPIDAPDPWQVEVIEGPARGPAAARNAGWQASSADWVAFLDDDVVVEPDWLDNLQLDLKAAEPAVAGVQGNIVVPLPRDRRPTDWERNVAGLQTARWATADMAYRREVLATAGGFEERFRRAYREDADLALRVLRRGWRLEVGRRTVTHPPGAERFWTSVRLQAGNADDALMRALHGRGWRAAASAPPGRLPRHLLTSGFAAAGLAGAALGNRRLAASGAAGWLAGMAELALARIYPGPRTAGEVAKMLATSAVLPVAASWYAAAGRLRHRRPHRPPPEAVLLDRDGTLVDDEPYNREPDKVLPKPGGRRALDRLRRAGVALAVVSNQSGVARGYLTVDDVRRVNARVEELLGPFAYWCVCPHGPDDGCVCRKPRPGLLRQALDLLGVPAERAVMIGDIGADVEAAAHAGMPAILVPTPITRREEIAEAPHVAQDLNRAVDLLLGGGR